MSREDNLTALRSAIEKRHGRGRIGRASMMRPHDIPRIPTGSLSLDFVIGGGLPIGRTIMFRGPESSGKSTTSQRIAGIAQGLCANCLRPPADLTVEEAENKDTGEVEFRAVAKCDCAASGLYVPRKAPNETEPAWRSREAAYRKNSFEEYRVALVDMEASYDPSWGEVLGLDNNRLVHVIPDTAEEAIDIYCALLSSGSIDMIIMDSIAAMTPSKEIEASAEDWQQGLQARLVNKFVRKAQSASNQVAADWGRVPTQVWIQQEREKIGISFGDPTVVPGGKGQLFACSVIMQMWSSKWKKGVVDGDFKAEFQIDLGREVRMNFRTIKNKTFPAKGTGSYTMGIAGSHRGEVLEQPYLLAQAEKYGAVRKESDRKWWLGDETFTSKASMLARMEEPEVRGTLKKVLLERMLGSLDAMSDKAEKGDE